MSERLPVLIDPKALAQRKANFAGNLAVNRMERLSTLLVQPFTEVNVEIDFSSEGQRSYLQGNISGDLFLECQRCLEPLKLRIDHQIHLGIVETESEISEIQGTGEPLLVDGSPVKLIEIIEDELLLLLPMYAMHDLGECSNNLTKKLTEPNTKDYTKKKNPFDVLSRMKTK